MKRFFFDLVSEFAAHDYVGHQCATRREAKDHARFIAQRIGAEKPYLAKTGSFIRVRDEKGARYSKRPYKRATCPAVLRVLPSALRRTFDFFFAGDVFFAVRAFAAALSSRTPLIFPRLSFYRAVSGP
jgi:hypothetical protein